MNRMPKLTIALPADLLQRIDAARSETGETRSQFLRRAVERELRASGHQKAIEQYVRGYEEHPESEEEIAEAMSLAQEVFAYLDREDGGWLQSEGKQEAAPGTKPRKARSQADKADLAARMDETRERIGPIGVSTWQSVREARPR